MSFYDIETDTASSRSPSALAELLVSCHAHVGRVLRVDFNSLGGLNRGWGSDAAFYQIILIVCYKKDHISNPRVKCYGKASKCVSEASVLTKHNVVHTGDCKPERQRSLTCRAWRSKEHINLVLTFHFCRFFQTNQWITPIILTTHAA